MSLMKHASASEQDYFRCVALQNQELPDDQPPRSVEEMFERMESLRNRLGHLAQPGQSDSSVGDLNSHLEYLKRLRFIDHAYRA